MEPEPEPAANEPVATPTASVDAAARDSTGTTATRYCAHCGRELGAGDSFCNACGSSVEHPGLRAASLFAEPWQSPFPPLPPANGLAIAALILGVTWIWWLGSLAAIITGHIALHQIKRSGGRERGRGLAIGGLALGYLGLATLVAFIVILSVAKPDFNYIPSQPPVQQGHNLSYLEKPHAPASAALTASQGDMRAADGSRPYASRLRGRPRSLWREF